MIITFAKDNTQAGTWFALLYQAFAQAQPGPRPLRTLAIERDVLAKLQAISDPAEQPTVRRLREPATVTLTEPELALLVAYLSAAGFQPYLSSCVLDLLAFLAAAPTTGDE